MGRLMVFRQRIFQAKAGGASLHSFVRCVELLEPRCLLSADVVLMAHPGDAIAGAPFQLEAKFVRGNETDFADFFGPEIIPRTSILLDQPRGGIFVDGELQIYGGHQREGSYSGVSPAIQVGSEIIFFESIWSAQGSSSPYTNGRINAAAILEDGSVIYVGQSKGKMSPGLLPITHIVPAEVPTFWSTPSEPQSPLFTDSAYSLGWIVDVSETGVFVGGENGGSFSPYYGTPEDTFWNRFPGTRTTVVETPYGSARDISRDGKYVVTPGHVWISDAISGYKISNIHPGGAMGVETDANGVAYFAEMDIDIETYAYSIGFRREDGILVSMITGQSAFWHMEFSNMVLANGELIASIHDAVSESWLMRVSDGATITLGELIGGPELIVKNVFASDGKLGLLVYDYFNNEIFATAYATLGVEPITVDLHYDFDNDGVFDQVAAGQNSVKLAHTYDAPGTYTATVVAMTPEGLELARRSIDIVVAPPWVVDVTLIEVNSMSTTGSVVEATGESHRFHEWQTVGGEVWLTVKDFLLDDLVSVTIVLHETADRLISPQWIDTLGNGSEIQQSTSEGNKVTTATIEDIDLSGFTVGDRILIGTLQFQPNLLNAVGVSLEVTGDYPQPTPESGLELVEARLGDGKGRLGVETAVPGEFVPVIYDSDDNGRVGLSDFVQFISNYGKAAGPEAPEAYRFDYDRNGVVGLSDFVLFIQHYGLQQNSAHLKIVMPGLYPSGIVLEGELITMPDLYPTSHLLAGEPIAMLPQGKNYIEVVSLNREAQTTETESPEKSLPAADVEYFSRSMPAQPQLDPRLIDASMIEADFWMVIVEPDEDQDAEWNWVSGT